MSERLDKISKLRSDFESRASYIKAKLSVLVPSKIKALRLKSNMPRQRDLAVAAKMQQSRISMFETPGAANLTLETLAKLAAAFKVGLIIDFVPFSQMLQWENSYSQDVFDVTRIDEDTDFIAPKPEVAEVQDDAVLAKRAAGKELTITAAFAGQRLDLPLQNIVVRYRRELEAHMNSITPQSGESIILGLTLPIVGLESESAKKVIPFPKIPSGGVSLLIGNSIDTGAHPLLLEAHR